MIVFTSEFDKAERYPTKRAAVRAAETCNNPAARAFSVRGQGLNRGKLLHVVRSPGVFEQTWIYLKEQPRGPS